MLFNLGLMGALVACTWLIVDLVGARGPRWRRLPFIGLGIATGLYAGGELLTVNAADAFERQVGRHTIYLGAGLFPFVWLWSSSALARPAWYRRAPWLVALPSLLLVAAMAWRYPDAQAHFGEVERYGLHAGPVYWSGLALAWLMCMVGIVQFVRAGMQMPGVTRARLCAIGVFATTPLLASAAYMISYHPGPDPTPILFGLCGVGLRYALFDSGFVRSSGQWDVFEQLPSGALLADSAGTVIYANPAARELLGADPLGTPLDEHLEAVGLDPERVVDVQRVNLHRRMSGRVGWAALLSDRTEAARLERHLGEQQRLESISLLAGGLAHDFRSLATRILTGAGLARMMLEPTHVARVPLQEVVQGARLASRLTRQLVGLSGRAGVEKRPVDIAREVRELGALLAGFVPGGVGLDLDLARDLPAVEADRLEIQQIVTNLTTNAAQATTQGGLVCIRSYAAELGDDGTARLAPGSPARPGPHVVLEVSDDGVGIDETIRERIFDPLFSTRPDGHGLGLAAVLGIAHRHGGGVEVESESDQGSVFRVWLPASARAAQAPDAAPERELFATGEGRLLVVEDDDGLRELVCGALERMGYTVWRAEDGSEAHDILRELRDDIDLVILDLDLPGISGRQTWQALAALCPDLRVVLASAFREGAPEAELRERAVGVLHKPYELAELFGLVSRALAAPRRLAG